MSILNNMNSFLLSFYPTSPVKSRLILLTHIVLSHYNNNFMIMLSRVESFNMSWMYCYQSPSFFFLQCCVKGLALTEKRYNTPAQHTIYTQTFISYHEEKWGHYTTINTFSLLIFILKMAIFYPLFLNLQATTSQLKNLSPDMLNSRPIY